MHEDSQENWEYIPIASESIDHIPDEDWDDWDDWGPWVDED